MSERQITKGPVAVTPALWDAGKSLCIKIAATGRIIAVVDAPINERDRANAEMIAEAFNVYYETGLTPRELAEQRAELRAELDMILEWALVEKEPLRKTEIDHIIKTLSNTAKTGEQS